MIQRSEEWFSARLGKVTASRIADVMAKTKTGYSASRQNYMMELLTERLTGERTESYQSADMLWGIEHEDESRELYESITGNTVMQVGFIIAPDNINAGASPDGLIGIDGGLEIKCPKTATHVNYILTENIDTKYIYQMQWGMYCTNRMWWDFVSYDPRMHKKLRIFIKRVDRDEDMINNIRNEVYKFLDELNEIEKKLKEKINGL